MKTLLRILAWAAAPAARWVAMPLAMPREMFITARKAAERPTAMTYTYCKYPDCKRS
jgi:hypothetical protein